MIARLAFAVVATTMLGSGLLAVRAKSLVHSVLWLAVTLIATAAAYVMLSAPFLAALQIVLYTGGVITLMLFGVMLTDHRHAVEGRPNQSEVGAVNMSARHGLGAVLALAVFGGLAFALYDAPLPPPAKVLEPSTVHLGELVLGDHLVAFEAVSVLLLAAMLAAIALSRKVDP